MSDAQELREMLELAAKAAGITGTYQHWVDGGGRVSCGIAPAGSPGCKWWNPLLDDGDALRLAVKLDIEIEPVPFGGRAIVRDDDDYGEQFDEESPNRMAATRRAIVRAAAEIGRNKA